MRLESEVHAGPLGLWADSGTAVFSRLGRLFVDEIIGFWREVTGLRELTGTVVKVILLLLVRPDICKLFKSILKLGFCMTLSSSPPPGPSWFAIPPNCYNEII